MGMPKIYLDNCCYNRPYDNQLQMKINLEAQAKLYIQKLIVEKKLELVYSFISRYENSLNPYAIRRDTISDFFCNASEYVSEENIDVIKEKAKEIMKTGVKLKDALHVACAIYARCDYFLSTDKRLLKYSTSEIKLINPIDFVSELEG